MSIPIPIRVVDYRAQYLIDDLLGDGSVAIKGELLADKIKQAFINKPLEKLQHVEVRYEVTDHCNASCIMCPRDEHEHGREHGIMDQNKYEKSIDEVLSLGAKRIVLTGFGEPLLDKKLEKKIAYAHSKGLNTYFISNGSALTEKRSRALIEAGLDEIRVSFYGMGVDTYNKVMRGLDYETTKEKLLGFIKIRNQMAAKTKVQVSYLEMEENKQDTEVFQKYWEPLVEALEIWRPHNFGDGRDYRDRHIGLNLKSSCGRPESGPLQIQWNGEVVPCCYDYNNKIVLGNAFEQPVLEILNNAKYRLLRQAHSMNEFNIFPYCDQCDQLLPHSDALIYTNRHNLPPEEAVKLSNTDLYNLDAGKEIDNNLLSEKYK